MRTTVLVGVALAAVALAAGSGAAAGSKPKVVEVYYAESDDGSSANRRFEMAIRRAEAVRYATRYQGRHARAAAEYKTHSDTGYGGDAAHPWRAVAGAGGKKLKRLIHDALTETGRAKVRVNARGDSGGRLRQRIEIVLADCAQDPPFYPISCTVKP